MLIATPQVSQTGLSTNQIHFALTSLSFINKDDDEETLLH